MTHNQPPAILAQNISKCFKLYNRRIDRLKETFLPFSKQYHTPFHALTDVSFTIEQSDTVGIIGRNGSGKSTLLQVICGILQPTGGNVQAKGRISALLELGAGFNPDFTGRENVYFNASILGISKEEIDDCFDDIVRFADIGTFIDQPVKTYSSGMYVRLAFSVAIYVKPEILIVDEALAVGDLLFQAKCFAKFREFQKKGITILFVTHSMDLVTRYCNHALLLEQGKLLHFGPAKDVVDDYNRMIAGHLDSGTNNKKSSDDQVGERQPSEGDNGSCSQKLVAHMRESQVAFHLNPNENRYGNGKAEIIELGIDSLSKEGKYSLVHGEKYRFWIKVQFYEDIKKPIFAYTIKDIKGFDITGTNTYYQKIDTGEVRKGDTILAEFDQLMMLNSGAYLLSFGCAGFENGEYVVFDRRYDVISFEVISKRESVGVFDLNSTISLHKVGC